jgi:ABC-type lipoprotein release transport system permease subunit
MNLSTARSEKRAREVGIRKTLGSRRGQLVAQLFIESILVALLAWGVALILVSLALPFFNALSAKDISLPLRKTGFWALTLGFTLFTGLLAGSYPALYLSAFRPVKVLKGVTRAGRFAAAPRRVLVVLQFTVSVALIIGTLTVYRQVQYAKDRPVGYTRAGLITVDMNTPDIFGHYNALREDLLRTGAVTDMAQSSSLPTDISSVQSGLEWAGKDPRGNLVLGVVAVTHDYGKTIGWQVVQGRDFSRDYPTDTGAFVINEAAAKLMGFAHPVGQTVRWGPGPHKILGVVRDMVMDNPYDPAVPTVFVLNYNWAQEIIVRTPGPEALAKIAPVFQRYNPGSPFEYKFTDQEYDRKFAAEERIGHLAGVFAVLAIFISCLGLFGLAGYTAEQRTKEIGVRKVLGASLYSIWKLLSGEFVVLVLVSCLIAAPLSGYFLRGWLAHYVYRASLSWWIFAAAAAGALLITLATVSWQALRAGLANPVRSLRSE